MPLEWSAPRDKRSEDTVEADAVGEVGHRSIPLQIGQGIASSRESGRTATTTEPTQVEGLAEAARKAPSASLGYRRHADEEEFQEIQTTSGKTA